MMVKMHDGYFGYNSKATRIQFLKIFILYKVSFGEIKIISLPANKGN